MEFYKIQCPTLRQFIDAIENYEYFTMDQFNDRKKQLFIYLSDKFNCEPILTWQNMTNTGGYPIIYPSNESIEDLLNDMGENFENQEDMDSEVELMGMFAQRFFFDNN
jgi:hypothetical protein